MPGKKITNIVGKTYGLLTVLEYSHTVTRCGVNRPVWSCLCACGNTHLAEGHALKSGNTNSCGCRHDKRKQREADILHLIRRHPEGVTRTEMCEAFNIHYQHIGRQLKQMVADGMLEKVAVYGPHQDKRTRPLAYIYLLSEWDGTRRKHYERIVKPKPTVLLDRIMACKQAAPIPTPWQDVEQRDAAADNGWAQVDGKWEYVGR